MSLLELRKDERITSPAQTGLARMVELEEYRNAAAEYERKGVRDYLRSVRKHRKLIVAITVLSTALAAVYLATKPDIYEAQALVRVDEEDLNPVGTTPKVIVSAPNDTAQFNTQLQILTSSGLLRRVVKTLDLEHNDAFFTHKKNRSQSAWRNFSRMIGLGKEGEAKDRANNVVPFTGPVAPPTSEVDFAEAKRLDPLVADVLDDLWITPVLEKRMGYARDSTRLIEIHYSHPDPQMAARLVNAIVDVFIVSNLERMTERNVAAGDFMQKRIAELQGQIRNAEERLITYAKNNQILSLDANQNTVVERLVGLNKQLLEAENERKLAESAYQSALAPGAASALAEENSAKKLVDIETRLAGLRERRAQLLVNNTPEWSEVQETDKQIEVLQKEVEQSRNRSTSVVLTNLETHYRQALARENALRAAFDKQKSETVTQNEAAINYKINQQEIETNKNLLDGLLQRHKENDVALAGIRNNIHVVDYAVGADKPIGPKRLQGIALTLVLSLAFSFCIALLLDYLNDTIQSVSDVEQMLHLPVLATVPSVAGARNFVSKNGTRQLSISSGNHQPLVESFRVLRTSILLSMSGREPKTLLVSSSVPSEGKTTTAANLATSLAHTGARVLVIDADLRDPAMSTILGAQNRPGLSTYLSSGMSDAELLSAIEYKQESNISLLPAGPIPPNSAELLGSDRMRHLITVLEADFTHIILDSPPAASFTDAVLLSSLVDGVLLVVQSNKSPVDVIRRTRQLFLGVGAKILGVVLNQLDLRFDDYYYKYGYYSSANPGLESGSGANAQTPIVTTPSRQADTARTSEESPSSPSDSERRAEMPGPAPASSQIEASTSAKEGRVAETYLTLPDSFEEYWRMRCETSNPASYGVAEEEQGSAHGQGPQGSDLVVVSQVGETSPWNKSPRPQGASLADLSGLDEDDAFGEIRAAFSHPAPDVRDAAARALYDLSPAHAAYFARLIREVAPEHRRNIGSAMASCGISHDAIKNAVEGRLEEIQDSISLLFLMAKTGEVEPLLRSAADHPDNQVRLSLIRLIGLTGREELIPALRSLAMAEPMPGEVVSAIMEATCELMNRCVENGKNGKNGGGPLQM